MACSVNTGPAPAASTLPDSHLPANGPHIVNIDDVLQKLDDLELKAVVALFAEKKAEKADRRLVQPTWEEWRAAKNKRAEQGGGRACWWKREPDDEDGRITPKLPQCYEEIKNLLWIEKSANPIYAKALEEWSKKKSLLTNRVERKVNQVAHLKNEIYQLIGFFSVFQGVVLTAVAQSNLLHCNNQWWPILLSVVASVVTIFGVVQKLMAIKALEITIHSERQALKVVINRLNTLQREGIHKFKFANFLSKRPKKQSTHRFWIYFWLVILSLVVFTVSFPVAMWRILCHPGPNPYPIVKAD